MWWVRELLKKNPNGRPLLIEIRRTRYLDFSGIKLLNSPHFHLSAKDIDQAYFHDFEIEVDIMGQLNIG